MTAITISRDVHKPLTRSEYEDFFYNEAALLDRYQFDAWYALFTPDAVYEVPRAGAEDDADSSEELFYIADDYQKLGFRVDRMKKPANHSEWPPSVCSRMISNVRITGVDERGVHVETKFITHRSKNEVTDVYHGHHLYILRQVDGRTRIASKRTFLDMNALRPQGKVTIFI